MNFSDVRIFFKGPIVFAAKGLEIAIFKKLSFLSLFTAKTIGPMKKFPGFKSF